MAKEELIPMIIHVGPGQCDQCLGPITIFDQDLAASVLSAGGYPMRTESLFYSVHGYCPECKKRFEMVRNGMCYEKYSRTGELYKQYLKSKNKLDDRDKDLRDENPFATIAGRYKNV